MPVPLLVVTPGGLDSNSYAVEQEMRDYADSKPNSTDLSTKTDEELRPYLLQATVILDSMKPFGYSTYSEGSLLWPRNGVYKRNGLTTYSNTSIPIDLKNAQCELALSLVEGDILSPSDLAGFESLKIGPIDLKADLKTEPSAINDTARLYLGHLMYSVSVQSTNGGSVDVMRL